MTRPATYRVRSGPSGSALLGHMTNRFEIGEEFGQAGARHHATSRRLLGAMGRPSGRKPSSGSRCATLRRAWSVPSYGNPVSLGSRRRSTGAARRLRRSYSASTRTPSSASSRRIWGVNRPRPIATSCAPPATTFWYQFERVPKPEMTIASPVSGRHERTSRTHRYDRPVLRPRWLRSRNRCPSNGPAPNA